MKINGKVTHYSKKHGIFEAPGDFTGVINVGDFVIIGGERHLVSSITKVGNNTVIVPSEEILLGKHKVLGFNVQMNYWSVEGYLDPTIALVKIGNMLYHVTNIKNYENHTQIYVQQQIVVPPLDKSFSVLSCDANTHSWIIDGEPTNIHEMSSILHTINNQAVWYTVKSIGVLGDHVCIVTHPSQYQLSKAEGTFSQIPKIWCLTMNTVDCVLEIIDEKIESNEDKQQITEICEASSTTFDETPSVPEYQQTLNKIPVIINATTSCMDKGKAQINFPFLYLPITRQIELTENIIARAGIVSAEDSHIIVNKNTNCLYDIVFKKGNSIGTITKMSDDKFLEPGDLLIVQQITPDATLALISIVIEGIIYGY